MVDQFIDEDCICDCAVLNQIKVHVTEQMNVECISGRGNVGVRKLWYRLVSAFLLEVCTKVWEGQRET